VTNIRNWAELMPGLQSCDIVGDDDSHWVLKVGVGALVRTVKVNVHVDRWDGPERVLFTFRLQGDPVAGGGSYVAAPTSGSAVDMTLSLRVEGTGPMAPMWEAMAGPLLPKFALAFAQQLAEGIEQANAVAAQSRVDRPTALSKLVALLHKAWRSLTGAKGSRDRRPCARG
jgi:carbon monoxide dehydrogenase subunit G